MIITLKDMQPMRARRTRTNAAHHGSNRRSRQPYDSDRRHAVISATSMWKTIAETSVGLASGLAGPNLQLEGCEEP